MNLRDYLHMLRRRWRVIATVLFLTLAVNVFMTLTATPLYQSQTRLFVSTPDLIRTDPLQAGSFAIQRVSTYVDLATGDELASRVVKALNLNVAPSTLAKKISAVAVPETVILGVSVKDPDPRRAQRYTQVTAQQLIEFVSEIESSSSNGNPGVRMAVATPANLPTSPVSPQPVRNFELAIVVGLLLGVGAANVWEQLDPVTYKRPSDARRPRERVR